MDRAQRMTKKALGAIKLIAEQYDIAPVSMRKDREALQAMYKDLEANHYEWIAAKQEWAYIAAAAAAAPETATFVTAITGMSATEGLYVLTEGFKAAGYDVVGSAIVYDTSEPDAAFACIEVKL